MKADPSAKDVMRALIQWMTLVAFVPLTVPALVLIPALLTGTIRVSGIWRDSFDVETFSPARVAQSIAALCAAAAVLIGLARSGGTAFAPLPDWLLTVTGGSNVVYLAVKWKSSRGINASRTAGGSVR